MGPFECLRGAVEPGKPGVPRTINPSLHRDLCLSVEQPFGNAIRTVIHQEQSHARNQKRSAAWPNAGDMPWGLVSPGAKQNLVANPPVRSGSTRRGCEDAASLGSFLIAVSAMSYRRSLFILIRQCPDSWPRSVSLLYSLLASHILPALGLIKRVILSKVVERMRSS